MLEAEAVTGLRDMSAQFGKCNFDGKPALVFVCVRPYAAHLGAGVAGDHSYPLCAAESSGCRFRSRLISFYRDMGQRLEVQK